MAGAQLGCLLSEEAAAEFVEKVLYPEGPSCPRCNRADKVGPSKRPSGKICYRCHSRFSIRKGTIFDYSSLSQRGVLVAIFLLTHCATVTARDVGEIAQIGAVSAQRLVKRIRQIVEEAGSRLAELTDEERLSYVLQRLLGPPVKSQKRWT